MRVSVVIPAYDNGAGLEECLRALVPGGAHEIIVVDDASTDDTGAVASRFGVQVVRLERNSGAGAARNRGAMQATGDVLLFVHRPRRPHDALLLVRIGVALARSAPGQDEEDEQDGEDQALSAAIHRILLAVRSKWS